MSEQTNNQFQEGLTDRLANYEPTPEALHYHEGAAVGAFIELIEAPTRDALAATLAARSVSGDMAGSFGYSA